MGWVRTRMTERPLSLTGQPMPGYSFAPDTGQIPSQAEPQPNDVFIVVMGPTGSGKTSYINLCSGTNSLEVGHGLRSCTESIAEATFIYNGFRVHLIDTPGFNDTSRPDSEILMELAWYLATTYNHHMRIDGLIYITPITDVRFSGSARKNLKMFSRLVGEESLSKVVLATSKWDEMPTSELAESREESLVKIYWKVLIEEGSTVYRLDGHKDSALHVVNALLPRDGSNGETLQIQRELVDESRPLDETKAGKELADDFRRLQGKTRKALEAMRLEMNYAIALKDEGFLRALSDEQDLSKREILRLEDEKNRLQVDFRQMNEDRDQNFASLTRQIEMERKEQADHIEKVNSEINRLRTKLENQSSATTESTRREPWNPAGPEKPMFEHLEEELAKCRKEITEKDARMEDMRNFMRYLVTPIKDFASPPPPYSQSATPINTLAMEQKEQNLIEYSETSQSLSEDDTDNSTNMTGLKSPLARKRNRSYKNASAKRKSRDAAGRLASRHDQVNQRTTYDDRFQIQKELYQHSLHSMVDHTRTVLSLESTSQLAVLARDSAMAHFNVNTEYNGLEKLQDLSRSAKKWLLECLLCRDIALTVYANCRRLQISGLARDYFSLLTLPHPPQSRQTVATLKRVVIMEVQSLVKALFHLTDQLYDPLEGAITRILKDSMTAVHGICGHILAIVGLHNCMTTLTEKRLQEGLESLLKEPFEDQADGLSAMFCEWQCVLQALDIGVLAYAGAHVSDFHENILANEAEHFQFPEPSLSSTGTYKLAQAAKRIQCRRLRLKCLSSFLEGREVWVFDDTMGHGLPQLYLAADIETFADSWGPVWKVADLKDPSLIAKYNVRGGSILPWRFDANVHPKLEANERLCHWRSNADYIRGNGPSSPNLSSSSSTTSSETEDIPADESAPESFMGLEILVIGADQSPRLRWRPCKCPVNSLKQHLKNAGRLDDIIASKSYRYVEAQQNSLVFGSHGVQAGHNRTWKDKREEPLKKSLLDRWENEADSRDPRRLENLWGVAVSLCTMNAQRVRLVELLAEESVIALLRYFPWSDLNHDGTSSRIRKRYLKAVNSDDPLALGDLWDRHPSWRRELGNAILVCLRILFRTGYDDNRDEFHMLWLPPRCRTPRRVTLKPTDQSWVKFLKDTTDSVTVAVMVEDSLGSESRNRCSGNRPRWFKSASILETAICINNTLDPTSKLIQTRGCQDENHYITRRDFEDWPSTWDVSALGTGDHLWMSSQTRVRTIYPLTKWHLLLEVDTARRLVFREVMGMKPSERIGHWEYMDEELDGDDVRPIPVHITS